MLSLIYIFLISFKSWSIEAYLAGEKVFLNNAKSYHFSSKKLVDVFTSQKPYYMITKSQGLLSYKEGNTDKKLLILSKAQKRFYNQVSDFTKGSELFNWSYKNDLLILKGTPKSLELIDFLILSCENLSEGGVRLDLPTLKKSKCLKSEFTQNSYIVDVVILYADKLDSKDYGLGAPGALDWIWQKNDGFQIQNAKGALKHQRQKSLREGELYFSGLVSKDSPLNFESGLDIGIQPKSIFAKSSMEWKKATSLFKIDLKDESKKELKVSFTVTKDSRLGSNNLFSKQSFKKMLSLEKGKWLKVLSFMEADKSKAKLKVLNLSLFGSRSRSKTTEQKEIWVRLSDDSENY